MLQLSTVVLAAAAGLALLTSCGDSGQGAPARSDRLILISLDTLRADRMSLYGYERPTTPNLERFAKSATTYTRAQAAAPWTLPSHASLFTGKHPYEHGARTWTGDELSALASKGWSPQNNVGPLAEEHRTLAEVLRDEGYATGAIVANRSYLDPHFGIGQGFEHYDQGQAEWTGINARALQWLDSQGDGPFFLFLNYMDTHRPYNTRPREGFDGAATYGHALAKVAPLVLDPKREVPPKLLEACRLQYDLAIANLDEGLGHLFQALQERGLYEGTTIMVTSDHGEFLGEKQLIEHSKDVYQGVLHIPLLVKVPGQAKAIRDERWIGHVHMPALVLPHLKLNDRRQASADLVHHRRGTTPVLSENYYTRSLDLSSPWGDRFRRIRRTLVQDRWKYISSSDGQHELFDLERDPAENHSLLGMEPDMSSQMKESLRLTLEKLQAAPPPGTIRPLGPDQIQSMEHLGYLGGSQSSDQD